MKHIIYLIAVIFAFSATAQDQVLDLYYTDDTVQIIAIKKAKVCYATFNLTSANGTPAFFSTYRLKDGDRWQVAGYQADNDGRKDDIITIIFDAEPFMVRGFEWDGRGFYLPFTEATELRDFDELVEASDEMTLELLRRKDTITLDMLALRSAKEKIADCVGTL